MLGSGNKTLSLKVEELGGNQGADRRWAVAGPSLIELAGGGQELSVGQAEAGDNEKKTLSARNHWGGSQSFGWADFVGARGKGYGFKRAVPLPRKWGLGERILETSERKFSERSAGRYAEQKK